MSDFVCYVKEGLTEERRELYRGACKKLDFYAEHEGKRYCVLHFPDEKKKDDFKQVLENKLAQKDYNFAGAVFPEGTSRFDRTKFDADTIFADATFLGVASFSDAQFHGNTTTFIFAQFRGEVTSFYGAVFSSAPSFSGAQFSGNTTFWFAEFSGSEMTDFTGAEFSDDTTFANTQFSGGWTNFTGAQFSARGRKTSAEGMTDFTGAEFSGKRIDFIEVQFNSDWTEFSEAQFSNEMTDFSEAQFSSKETYFSGAQFGGERTRFSRAQFSGAETSFKETTFPKEVSFVEATFRERVAFWGSIANPVFDSQAWVRFDNSRIEKPELLTFNSVLLHPGWFINTDVRKVDFTEVKWYGMPGGPEGTLDEELSTLEEHKVEARHTLLAQACRRLSANAEENREYPLANAFHYWSMDALRKQSWDYRRETWDGLVWIRRNWLRVARRCGPSTALRLVWDRIIRRRRSRPRNFGLIPTLYWASSGYGVSPASASLMLFAIWFVFTVLYFLIMESSPFWVFSASDIGQGIEYARQAAVFSLSALVRLNPRPQAEELDWFQTLVTIEGILGPLQIALLALAIRRKVMR